MGWVGKFKWSFRDPKPGQKRRGEVEGSKGVGQAIPGPYSARLFCCSPVCLCRAKGDGV
jgi:hypothetical protein